MRSSSVDVIGGQGSQFMVVVSADLVLKRKALSLESEQKDRFPMDGMTVTVE